MSTKSYTSLRRLSAFALTLLLFCVTFGKRAGAQATTPVVTGSFATNLTAPSGLGTVFQTALDSHGDLVVVDYSGGGLYEYPAGSGTPITLVVTGGMGGYANPGIAIDSNDDLYIEANYNNCLLRFPYNTATQTWDGLSSIDATNTTAALCPGAGGGTSPYIFAQYGLSVTGTYPGYYQPWALALLPGNNLLISSQNSGNFIFSMTVTGSGANTKPGQGTVLLDAMSARPQSVTEDKFGNVYFVEEVDQKAPLPGVLMIPAGSPELASDAGLARVDPNLPAVTGVTTDAAGNLYISDSKLGVFMVPNPSGTPNTSGAVLLTTEPATGQVTLDAARGLLYVPTSNNGLAKVRFNAADLGSTAAGGAAGTSQSVRFGFNSAATPGSFVIEEAGTATPDFTLATGGTCATGTAYAAQAGCTQNVTLSPHAAGSVSAKLLMLDASGKVLGSIGLHGTGTGPAVQVLAGGESAIGAGLKTSNQVAVDAAGNAYVADSGLGAVEVYPKGSGGVAAKATVGTGLTAPTGVAVDGAGDVFIADSGNVIEVPNGPTGLVAAGQITLKSGLGSTLHLATDGVGHLYIADPTNHQVVKLGNLGGSFGVLSPTEVDLTTGFNSPSLVATDSSGNLYVADGPNLIQVTPTGTQTTLLTSLAGETGLAVDPSGSVYVSEPGGTIRIPNQGGTLTVSAQTTVASDVTAPTSVAVDSAENVYITDGTAKDIDMVSASATTNFGTLTSTTGTQANSYTIQNAGNAPLNVTGFAGTPDYSETSSTCIGAPVAVDATCGVTITFNPGPGDQGTLSGEVLVQSDAANAPVGVNVTGVGATLAASATTITVTKPTVDGAPAVITVAPTSGKGAAPTGQVTLTITGTNLTTPVVIKGTLVNGTVTLTPPQLAAGTYTFSVAYQGDRTYGTSSGSASVSVSAGAVVLVQPPLTPALNLVKLGTTWYVLAGGNGSAEPYDGSVTQYTFTYQVSVAATDGIALIGQPVYSSTGKLLGENYGSVTYQGAPYTATGQGCPPVSVQSNGTAPLDMSCLTIDTSNTSIPNIENTYTITPMYGPTGTGSTDCNPTCVVNPNYAPVAGTPITVTALRNPMVQISSSPSTLNVSAGSTTTATLTLTSVLGYGIGGAGGLLNNYTLPVQLACDGLPANATCSFSYPKPDPSDPNSVDVGPPAGTVLSFGGVTGACAAAAPGAIGGCFGPGTVIMTINTNVPTGAIAGLRRAQDETVFAAMFGLGLLGFAFGKKKSLRKRVPTLMGLLLCGGILIGISGCSTKQLGTTSTAVKTPTGSYTVLVTAKEVGSQVITAVPGITYGNGAQVSLPFTVSLTVQ